jgi:hypothetical protein
VVSRLSAFAIFLGLAASTAAGLLTGAVGGVVLAFASPADLEWLSSPGAAPVGTGAAVTVVAVVLSGSLAAGYAAARLSVGDELINAFVTGILLLILTVLSYEEPVVHQLPLWSQIAVLGLPIPLSLIGGYLQRGAA